MTEETVRFCMSFPCAVGDDPIIGRLKHFVPLVGNSHSSRGLFTTICKVNHLCPSPLDGPNAAYYWDEESEHEREYSAFPSQAISSLLKLTILSPTWCIRYNDQDTVRACDEQTVVDIPPLQRK